MTVKLANQLVERSVLGKGLLSPLVVDAGTQDWKQVDGVDNVKACILDLISTRVGERLMNEDFGVVIGEALFESQEAVIDVVPVILVEAIKRFEPRVRSVQAVGRAAGETVVNINLSWVLRSTGRRDNLVYPFYLEPPEGGISLDL